MPGSTTVVAAMVARTFLSPYLSPSPEAAFGSVWVADQLDLSADDVRAIDAVNADEGVSWLFSFITADKLRTYCLYEAPSPDAIMEAARRANVPADKIVEVNKFVPAEMLSG